MSFRLHFCVIYIGTRQWFTDQSQWYSWQLLTNLGLLLYADQLRSLNRSRTTLGLLWMASYSGITKRVCLGSYSISSFLDNPHNLLCKQRWKPDYANQARWHNGAHSPLSSANPVRPTYGTERLQSYHSHRQAHVLTFYDVHLLTSPHDRFLQIDRYHQL